MFGADILFAPKVNEPTVLQHLLHKQEIRFYLPNINDVWYNYQLKSKEPVQGEWVTRVTDDLE